MYRTLVFDIITVACTDILDHNSTNDSKYALKNLTKITSKGKYLRFISSNWQIYYPYISENGQTHFENLAEENLARFLTYVWPFLEIRR